ncbi:hypothetical protein KKF92_00865 [Patescibacteria group bacterium]|nr:hypothetical protein [Patescibacteria group bacterium]
MSLLDRLSEVPISNRKAEGQALEFGQQRIAQQLQIEDIDIKNRNLGLSKDKNGCAIFGNSPFSVDVIFADMIAELASRLGNQGYTISYASERTGGLQNFAIVGYKPELKK